MSEVVNSLPRLVPNTQAVWGFITFTGGVPALGSQSGEATTDQAQVSIADTSTGVTTFTVKNFKGSAGSCIAFGNATTAGDIVTWGAASYSGDTLTIIGYTTDSAATAADDNFSFLILAY